jgi:quinol monooxygenase YgiN
MATSSAFVVIAEFEVKPDRLEAFLAAARDDAACSVRDEAGCRQFDVVLPDAQSRNVVFYEVYDSREAFDRHLETPHLARFRAAFPALIVRELPVRFGRRDFPA